MTVAVIPLAVGSASLWESFGMDGEGWLKIGEVSRRTGLSVRTLRHYDELGLLVPGERSAGDYRLYSPRDLTRLLHIQQLKSLGLGLADVRRALDDPGFDAAAVLDEHIDAVEARLASERDLLGRLKRLRVAADTGWEQVLDVVALSERLRHPDAAVRFSAILAAPREAPLEVLLERLDADREPGVGDALAWAIARHGSAALPAVIARAQARDPRVRHHAARILGKIGDPAAVATLGSLVADADPSTAVAAAIALGQIGGAEAASILVGQLGQGPFELRESVTSALGRCGPEALPPLLNALVVSALGAPAADVREHAAEVLGFRADAGAVRPLVEALDDPDGRVRLAALIALGDLDDDEATRAIAGLVGSHDGRTRLVAERLLADRVAQADAATRRFTSAEASTASVPDPDATSASAASATSPS